MPHSVEACQRDLDSYSLLFAAIDPAIFGQFPAHTLSLSEIAPRLALAFYFYWSQK
jgi:hypothetical protein